MPTRRCVGLVLPLYSGQHPLLHGQDADRSWFVRCELQSAENVPTAWELNECSDNSSNVWVVGDSRMRVLGMPGGRTEGDCRVSDLRDRFALLAEVLQPIAQRLLL